MDDDNITPRSDKEALEQMSLYISLWLDSMNAVTLPNGTTVII
jgi:hypothetical protein